jgi:hypothetical protein
MFSFYVARSLSYRDKATAAKLKIRLCFSLMLRRFPDALRARMVHCSVIEVFPLCS